MDYVFHFWLGVAVISVVGTLAHFVYDWTHHNKIVGLFAAVNESTWEHIKIALTPTFLWSIYDGLVFGASPNYFLAKLANLLSIVITIPLIFYAYRAVTKKTILPIDIANFYLSILFGQIIFYVVLTLPPQPTIVTVFSCLGLLIFFCYYLTLTIEPLKNLFFRDPITNRYGFRAHSNPFKSKKTKMTKNPKNML